MASLAHTRAGITDAMITCGSVEILTNHLFSQNAEVRAAAAVALGYLTFNRKVLLNYFINLSSRKFCIANFFAKHKINGQQLRQCKPYGILASDQFLLSIVFLC